MILNIEQSRYSLCLRYINININFAFFKLALEKEKKKDSTRAGVPFLYLLFVNWNTLRSLIIPLFI